MNDLRPEITEKTRVIHKSPAFGFPPLVFRLGVERAVVDRMRAVLIEMKRDPEGRPFLEGLKLDAFGLHPPYLFDDIRAMADRLKKAQPWLASVGEHEDTTRTDDAP